MLFFLQCWYYYYYKIIVKMKNISDINYADHLVKLYYDFTVKHRNTFRKYSCMLCAGFIISGVS